VSDPCALLTPGSADSTLVHAVIAGLCGDPKRLASSLLYDARGSALFERICEQPEYYLTRSEREILRERAGEIAQLLGERVLLIELGSGTSEKTRLLLDALQAVVAYVPVDVSRSALRGAVRRLARAYPALPVLPVLRDFTQPFRLPELAREATRRVFFFPGSTLGNFDAPDATGLLAGLRSSAGAHGALVIGFDLEKDPARLLAAYDDRAGVTAEFNRNVLRRLNRELGASFDLASFSHRARWNAAESRIEMQLVSARRQRVPLGGVEIRLAAGEPIVTEHCHKYTTPGFARLAGAAGWQLRRVWTDRAGDFAVGYLVTQPQ
jgi:dimethylhistidine N-methyltransferase